MFAKCDEKKLVIMKSIALYFIFSVNKTNASKYSFKEKSEGNKIYYLTSMADINKAINRLMIKDMF